MFKVTYRTIGAKSETVVWYTPSEDEAKRVLGLCLSLAKATAQAVKPVCRVSYQPVSSHERGVIQVFSVTSTEVIPNRPFGLGEHMVAVVFLHKVPDDEVKNAAYS